MAETDYTAVFEISYSDSHDFRVLKAEKTIEEKLSLKAETDLEALKKAGYHMQGLLRDSKTSFCICRTVELTKLINQNGEEINQGSNAKKLEFKYGEFLVDGKLTMTRCKVEDILDYSKISQEKYF